MTMFFELSDETLPVSSRALSCVQICVPRAANCAIDIAALGGAVVLVAVVPEAVAAGVVVVADAVVLVVAELDAPPHPIVRNITGIRPSIPSRMLIRVEPISPTLILDIRLTLTFAQHPGHVKDRLYR
jgi:hypothetical protein